MTVPVRRFEVRVVPYCLKESGRHSASMYRQRFRLIGHSLTAATTARISF